MVDKVISAIAEPRRREILELVRDTELTSTSIASHFHISAPAISQHLKVLEEAGLVIMRKSGTKRYYRIRRDGLDELKRYIDHFWDDALLRLKEEAEAEERRRNEST